jgi:hypothetical protein
MIVPSFPLAVFFIMPPYLLLYPLRLILAFTFNDRSTRKVMLDADDIFGISWLRRGIKSEYVATVIMEPLLVLALACALFSASTNNPAHHGIHYSSEFFALLPPNMQNDMRNNLPLAALIHYLFSAQFLFFLNRGEYRAKYGVARRAKKPPPAFFQHVTPQQRHAMRVVSVQELSENLTQFYD